MPYKVVVETTQENSFSPLATSFPGFPPPLSLSLFLSLSSETLLLVRLLWKYYSLLGCYGDTSPCYIAIDYITTHMYLPGKSCD